MYSEYMIDQAENRLHVVEEKNELWFRVDSSKSMHRVRFHDNKFSCDCWWFANMTIHGDKFCRHILAVIVQKLAPRHELWRMRWKLMKENNL